MAMTRRAVARENAGGLGAAPWWRALGYSVNGKWKMENGKWENGKWKMVMVMVWAHAWQGEVMQGCLVEQILEHPRLLCANNRMLDV